MRLVSSLTNRIFSAMALLTVVSIGAATYYATRAVTVRAEDELRRGLNEAVTLVEEYRRLLLDHFDREARLVADLPRLKAAVSTNDMPTVRPVAEELRQQLRAGLLVVSNARGDVLARLAPEREAGILQEVSVPITIFQNQPEVLGTLTVGFWLDAAIAARFKELTDSEIAFGADGRIRTSTLPEAAWPQLEPLLGREGETSSVTIGPHEYIAATRPLFRTDADARGTAVPPAARAVILRSRTERLQFLSGVHRTVLLMAIGAVLAAVLASYGIARTVTRPLATVTNAMREMARTGDLTHRVVVPPGAAWEDEDTRLLASTFNAMTGSIDRFQREAGQRERLSSLGRLSTVVAHEVRNPLMIIKTTLRGLRAPHISDAERQAAVASIEEEVTRLNRIVSEVLDFARPIKFDLQPGDINAICADAARAVSTPGGSVRLDLSPELPPLVTDSERLRLALVNVLTNASNAVAARTEAQPGDAVRLMTGVTGDGKFRIDVRDRGVGIPPEDLPRIFDPFFTTMKTGTGLGLALTRNIIEGLGGSITVASTPGRGTDVRIELPGAGAHV
jgi:signal transduction histidine kinase